MRDYEKECKKRVKWIKDYVEKGRANGIVFGNSGGKDSALVGLLCKMAVDNVLGVIMPCETKQNYEADTNHANLLAEKGGIDTITVDLTEPKRGLMNELNKVSKPSDAALNNINPRLRMTTLYTIGQTLGYLVAGTGNKSEAYMGYFTKWGDGAYDFNPIADLSATEVFEFLRYLNAPKEIVEKAPSAGLFEGQTDEAEMGVSYAAIDKFIEKGEGEVKDIEIINKYHNASEHKRRMPATYEI